MKYRSVLAPLVFLSAILATACQSPSSYGFAAAPPSAGGTGSSPPPASSPPVAVPPTTGGGSTGTTLTLRPISLAPESGSGRNATANYWNCVDRVSGSWAFGRAPYACDASSFGDDRHVTALYSAQIYNDGAASAAAETGRYVSQMYALIRDASAYYLRQRKPAAASDELAAWQEAAYAVAYQESFWSHYRLASDGRIKLMRGDSGHGHGMMQLDDRWHYVSIESGLAWELMGNLFLAFEEYYSDWQSAASASCVSAASSSYWQDRARAAYSAYNGGATQLCRWTNGASTWAANDQGFYSKLRSRDWAAKVGDFAMTASLNVGCVATGNASCALTP